MIDRFFLGEDYGKKFCCYTAAALGTTGVVLAYVGTAAAVIGAGVSIAAAIQQSEQQEKLANAAKKQKEIEAQAFREQAAYEEGQQRRRSLILLGKQQAIFAAAGVDTGSGSPLLQEIDLTSQLELEALNIRAFGARGASGKQFEAGIANYQARAARSGQTLSILGGVTSAVGGVASSYSSAYSNTYRGSVASRWSMGNT